ncbi:MAG: ABC transporter ATP-binding protein [Acutalibacteraceae bacterium]
MLEVKNLAVRYGKKDILQNINFKLTPHTITVVIGKNGCGKSTLVSCINGTTDYTGEISFNSQNIKLTDRKEKAKAIAILPQVLTAPHITTDELVSMGRNPYLDLSHHLTEADKNAIENGFNTVGINELRGRYLDSLSGGERQKAYLAMTIAQNTRLLVLDEPTTYMDMPFEHQFMRTLENLKAVSKKTVLVVMHNLNTAVKYADNILVLDKGEQIFYGSKEECLERCAIENTFGLRRFNANNEIFFAE